MFLDILVGESVDGYVFVLIKCLSGRWKIVCGFKYFMLLFTNVVHARA